MNKLKLGVIFGGMSTEHNVSIASGTSVIANLDNNKYEIYPIYIDKEGKWYTYNGGTKKYQVGEQITDIKKIDNVIEYLKQLDSVFPVLHGLYGEDGSIQGLLELLKIPYVGCRVLASSMCMDKVYSKLVFEKAGLKQSKYEYVKAYKDKYIYVDKDFSEKTMPLEEICKIAEDKLGYPIFVKPSNSGSSIGINKSTNMQELMEHINYAAKYDFKILLEQEIVGREVECSVLGNSDVKASCIGEVLAADDFYSFDAKYNNSESKTVIPAKISEELSNKIREQAIRAFKAVDGKGFARVDFFADDKTNEVYINEINTIPGFTQISMYPKLWEQSGLEYSKLLDELIELSIN